MPPPISYSESSYRLPGDEGLAYYNTLPPEEIKARRVACSDENHWILKPQNSRLWYREFFAWLKRF